MTLNSGKGYQGQVCLVFILDELTTPRLELQIAISRFPIQAHLRLSKKGKNMDNEVNKIMIRDI